MPPAASLPPHGVCAEIARRPRTNQRGFTLVELLVALAVFTLMAAIAYGGLAAMLEARASINAALDRNAALQSAVHRIATDLRQASDRPIRDAFGDDLPALMGAPESGIQFTRGGWRNPLQIPRSNLQRVAYALGPDGHLLRRQWRVLDRAQDSAPVETVLLEDVETLRWRYLSAQREWVDRWPRPQDLATGAPDSYAATAGLPLAVELTLEPEGGPEIRLLFALAGGGSTGAVRP